MTNKIKVILIHKLLSSKIQFLKGVGPANAVKLSKLGILTIGQLLEHYPRRYEDRSKLKSITELTDGQYESFRAVVIHVNELKSRRGFKIIKIAVQDQAGVAQLTWFNQSYMKNKYKPGMELIISGKIQRHANIIEVTKPDIEPASEFYAGSGRIIPVYPTTEDVPQWRLRSLILQAINLLKNSVTPEEIESLPTSIIDKHNLLTRKQALVNIHFAVDMETLVKARRRLVFEELFLLQCGLAYLKQRNKYNSKGIKHAPDGVLVAKVENHLSFKLTNDQNKTLREIKADMEDVTPMQRLVQGDVGSGKTVIAAIALAKTVENGYQGAMMAPTEILAEQHYHTLAQLLAPHSIKLAILTGKLSRRTRDEVLRHFKDGAIDVVVGTHALIQDDVEFAHLGLVVTDEQHRFGVRQRARLESKGNQPDVLIMTATPIPRTMALTVYGDLDVSIIRELPPGRQPVATYSRSNTRRNKVYLFAAEQIKAGRQVYVVCPLVEESDKIEAQSAVKIYEELSATFFKNIPCALLHGKMKPQEKEAIMTAFSCGDIKALIATTVIEVGVNVPNATVMIIEGADRFGLAQLHQLRGRVGRGKYKSYCILLSDNTNEETLERLKIMTEVNDGFVLADRDLLLRGPGQFFGTNQHGLPDLKIANIVTDTDILLEARSAAQHTVCTPEYLDTVWQTLQNWFGEKFSMIFCR
ncbi:ATP-dependent DNA helicase RecG [Sporomusa acidovorans]|uniref:ATP-dependent DNA helicase RecG n=1 Tax=Sporomusa acidovorans (strain ATCC 49682 / DSM 3132 / Mol) TaxID=1123286 RepID=A0ABZ3J2X6_SPOA4|nr:ATP-dependent DNA helicase RecG [Sporomusa acidovorans]OZC20204.1 ATP-dependent DNA helicase RecG [Sporomusa acidovorans DSM 3132]SDD42024.1 ATP-dependent DNA helicase RecG [Sporomusa acidovorans]